VADSPPGGEHERRATGLRTFLIADVRGYTRFSQEHGDEAASRLAHQFANIVREAVPTEGGELLELRGDEALCVFISSREALQTAVELQRRFRERVNGEPVLPLGVGIGLDAGEAIPIEAGYRGRALNVAARLCAVARPGEILASETVASLAGHQDAASYARRRPARLKGLEEPVRYVEVVPDVDLPPLPPTPAKGRARKPRLIALVSGAVVLAAALTVFAVARTGGGGDRVIAASVVPNSIAVIDPTTNRVVEDVRVGDGPGRIAVGAGKVWTLNTGAQTISLIDAGRRALIKTFGVGATPRDIAVALGSAWVGVSTNSTVLELNAETAVVRSRISAPPSNSPPLVTEERADAGALAFTGETLWFLSGNSTLSRIDATTGERRRAIRYPGITRALSEPAYIAAGEGGVWVSAPRIGADYVTRVDPSNDATTPIALSGILGPIAAGLGSVWVVQGSESGGALWQIDPRRNVPASTIRCKGSARDVAVGEDSVWVACDDGRVLRIDPVSATISRTIRVGGIPNGIAVGEGAVWVAVD
jgi:YVTN family beta-propeller protein